MADDETPKPEGNSANPFGTLRADMALAAQKKQAEAPKSPTAADDDVQVAKADRDQEDVQDAAQVIADPINPGNGNLAGAAVAGGIPNPLSTAKHGEHARMGYMRIALIGFPGSGKTFFLERLKREIHKSEKGSYSIFPPAKNPETGSVINQGITNYSSYHLFDYIDTDAGDSTETQEGKAHPQSFVIYDMPGEWLVQATDKQLQSNLFNIVAQSDALIMVLPSDSLFRSTASAQKLALEIHRRAADDLTAITNVRDANDLEETLHREAEVARLTPLIAQMEAVARSPEEQAAIAEALSKIDNRLSGFLLNMPTMLATTAAMRKSGKTFEEFDAQTEADKSLALQRYRKRDAPLTYIALAKADTVFGKSSPVLPLNEKLNALTLPDGDPCTADNLDILAAECLKAVQPTWDAEMAKLIGDNCKVEFLTSFDFPHHEPYARQDAGADYKGKMEISLPAYGVRNVITWLDYARRRRQLPHSRWEKVKFWFDRWITPIPELLIAQLNRVPALAEKRAPAVLGALWLALMGILALWSGGIVQAWATDSSLSHPITPKPRYASEANYLRSDNALFRNGVADMTLLPWSNIPDADPGSAMFRVRRTMRVRPQFDAILSTMQAWPATGAIDTESATAVQRRLNQLQRDFDAEMESAGLSGGAKAFINYHLGYALYRSGDFAGAAEMFRGAKEVLDAATPSAGDRAGAARLTGMRIANDYALGLAQLSQGGDQMAAAKASFNAAIANIPAEGRPARLDLTDNVSGFFIPAFQRSDTPAQLNSADVYSALIAADIRDFDFARDSAENSQMRASVNLLLQEQADIPAGHSLRTNLTAAAALLGISRNLPAPNENDRADHREIYASAHAATGANQQGSVWYYINGLRNNFRDGDAQAVENQISTANGALQTSRERAFVGAMAADVVAQERERLADAGGAERLASYAGKVPGFGRFALADDLAWPGGIWLWLGLSSLLAMTGIVTILRAARRTKEAARMLYITAHHNDRYPERAATPDLYPNQVF